MESKLSKYVLKEIDFFYSKDFDDPPMEIGEGYFFQRIIEKTLEDFLTPKFKKLVDLYSKENKLGKIAILYAHGYMKNKKWCYSDGENLFSVQSWINEMDGKYKLLILKVRNEQGHEISSKKSVVFFFNQDYSVKDREHGKVKLKFFYP